jgi:hypothetical protein
MSEARTAHTAPIQTAPFDQKGYDTLARVIDGFPELRGMGIVVIDNGRVIRIRPPLPSIGSTVVIENRPPVGTPGAAQAKPRDGSTSPAMEWMGLGLNCGGAVLAWVGVVGTSSLAPVTGGTSLVGTGLLWGGALASSAQCVVSVTRVANMNMGRQAANDAMDKNRTYYWTMLGLDVVGLIGAGGALKEAYATSQALEEAGVSWERGLGALNRNERLRLTRSLELQGARRVPAAQINRLLKQKLLDTLGAAGGIFGSASSGAIKELVVWIVSSPADNASP